MNEDEQQAPTDDSHARNQVDVPLAEDVNISSMSPSADTTPVKLPDVTSNSFHGSKKPFIKRYKKQAIVAAAVLILIGIVGVVMVLSRFSRTETPVADNEKNQSIEGSVERKEDDTASLTGIAFDNAMQEVSALPLFTEAGLRKYYYLEEDGSFDNVPVIHYYKIGSVDGGEIYLAQVPPDGIGNDLVFIFVKRGETYTLLANHTGAFGSDDWEYYGPELSEKVTLNKHITIDTLLPKETISYEGVTVSRTTNQPFFLFGANAEGLTEVAKIPEGVVYERVAINGGHSGVKQFSILLKQPSGLYVAYRYTTEVIKDDKTVAITFSDGKKTNEQYDWAMIRSGCGVIDSVNVLDKAYFGDLIEIGKANGEPVYQLKSADHPAMNSIYENYNYDGQREGAVSKKEFHDNRGVIIVRNKLGYRVILVNAKYQPQGECAKPVIYLYPEQITAMRVEVGADVRLSDPEYGYGWDVVALPDGSILHKGRTYPSLFWDGQGHGKYPDITEGFVVKRGAVESTLRAHLLALGLNDRESKDFLEYWLPLMPDTPYVRLTWFTTRQMDELAPLKLSVKPDTTIRVFLDFQGLEQPINLKPQRLTHPERKGFVLVEWGGLRYVY